LKSKKFKVIEEVLYQPLFKKILVKFKESDILVKACKHNVNKKTINWILSMGININARDEEGKTALMYAVERYDLVFLVKELLGDSNCQKELSDIYGNTALFYSTKNLERFKLLMNANCNYKHKNNDNEDIFLYCCRYDRDKIFNELISKPGIDINALNIKGKSAAMYCAENGKYDQLTVLVRDKKVDINYKNKFDNSILSSFIKKYDGIMQGNDIRVFNSQINYINVKNYAYTLKTLLELGCDMNVPIDDDGNVPIMYYLMTEDYVTAYYLLDKYPTIDLSIKNRYGINATYLSFFIKKEVFEVMPYSEIKLISYSSLKELILNNSTFDLKCVDFNNNNLLIHSIIRDDPLAFKILHRLDENDLLNYNNMGENLLIFVTKLGKTDILYSILNILKSKKKYIKEAINHQDELGNTALFYAVQLKDMYVINLLRNFEADIYIKNHQNQSPLDLARSLPDYEMVVEFLENKPLPINDKSLQEKSVRFKRKTSDEKLEEYIKNYRINENQNSYSYLLKNAYQHYQPTRYTNIMSQWALEVYYPNSGITITTFEIPYAYTTAFG